MGNYQETMQRTEWFRHDRFGLFIHWGLYSVAGRHEWAKSHERITDEAYQKYFDNFTAEHYDPVAWAKLAKKAGMKYAVLTVKHHEGFCLFDSAYTDYKSTNAPAARDLAREFVDAFRAEGLKVGDSVARGEVIATVAEANGNEYKDGAHLHFEIHENGVRIDPTKYLTLEEK